jgi:hypothetical protein
MREHDGERHREYRRPRVDHPRREARDEAACGQHWIVLRQ